MRMQRYRTAIELEIDIIRRLIGAGMITRDPTLSPLALSMTGIMQSVAGRNRDLHAESVVELISTALGYIDAMARKEGIDYLIGIGERVADHLESNRMPVMRIDLGGRGK